MDIRRVGCLQIAYRKGTVDEEAIDSMFRNDTYFVPPYIPRSGDIIMDIGSHIGTFALFAASKIKDAKIFAIEASRENFKYLEKNVTMNNLKNIAIYNFALSDTRGPIRLYHDIFSGSVGHSITMPFSERSEDSEEVWSDTLKNFLEASNIQDCNYARFNCEGSEFKIILNTPKEILQRIAIMTILYHEDLIKGFSGKDLAEYLKKCGFSVTVRILPIEGYGKDGKPKRGVIVALRKSNRRLINLSSFNRGLESVKKRISSIVNKKIF